MSIASSRTTNGQLLTVNNAIEKNMKGPKMNLSLTDEEIAACKIARKVLKRVTRQNQQLIKEFNYAQSNGNKADADVLTELINCWHTKLYKKANINLDFNVGARICIH